MKKHAREILRQCLQREKEGLDLYREAAARAARPRTRKAFEILIREEEEHIRRLLAQYEGEELGSAEEFIQKPPHLESPLLSDLAAAIDPELSDRKALEIALRLERENGEEYRRHAAAARDAETREIYHDLALDEDRHYQVVESEYAHLMAMVHETDIDIYVRE